MKLSEGGAEFCAFCRTPNAKSDHEHLKRTKKLTDKGNAEAFNVLAWHHANGVNGMPQDYQKAYELYLKAGELGCTSAYYNLGNAYYHGRSGEVDMEKAQHYFKLAAMMGDVEQGHYLVYQSMMQVMINGQ